MRYWGSLDERKLETPLNLSKITSTLSEQDIIELHEKFLTVGFQYVQVSDVPTGRTLLKNFLDSLNCYHNIACLSISDAPLEPSIVDLYQQLLANCFIGDEQSRRYIYELLSEEFDYDFLWIEMTEHVMDAPWFAKLESQLVELHIDQRIPIVVVSYDELSTLQDK